jgi:hypothetical protein
MERINTLQHYYVTRNLWGIDLNKPLFESSRDVQIPPHPYKLKKVLAGLFSIAMILLLLLAMLKMPLQVRAETSIPKPAVPEFTIELIDSSYDVPTTYSVDPYTGENVTHAGRHVESRTIEVKIKNQPFTPYQIQDSDGNSWTVNFYYNISFKGHSSDQWTAMFLAIDGYPLQNYESDYTVFSYQGEYSSTEGMKIDTGSKRLEFPAGAQVDFQVEAMKGYLSWEVSPLFGYWNFTGETSGWSNTQTVTIGESQTPTSPPANSPTPTPESPQADITVIAGVAIVGLVLGAGAGLLIFLKRK